MMRNSELGCAYARSSHCSDARTRLSVTRLATRESRLGVAPAPHESAAALLRL